MCIIIVKPAGIALPDSATLENCWEGNPDGAGFMYPYHGRVRIEKGFMSLKSFNKRLKKLRHEIDTHATPMVLHFRIGTHGENSPACTHPFPIVDSVTELQKIRTNCFIGVAHNGIIPIKPSRADISDTMEYILVQLALIREIDKRFYRNPAAIKLITEQTQSKLAFLTPDGEFYTIGDFVERDGLLYSNRSFEPWSIEMTTFGWSAITHWKKKPTMPVGWTDEEELMWLNPETEYIIHDDGTMSDAVDWLIDEDGNLYVWDIEKDAAIPVDDARVYPLCAGVSCFDEEWAELLTVKR